MAKSVFILTHTETEGSLTGILDFDAGNGKRNLVNLIKFLKGSLNGSRGNITLESRLGSTAATQIITATGAATATDTITINGVNFTARASSPAANEFVLSATVATQATNLAAAINASTTAGVANVTATAALGVVTLTCDVPGTIGNAMTLTEAMDNLTVGGANLAGGSDVTSVTWTA